MSKTVWERLLTHCGELRRDRENGLLMGVCAGLAGCYGVSALSVRVVACLGLWLLTVPTVIVYLVLALTLRDAPLTYFGEDGERSFWGRSGLRERSYTGGAGR